MLPVSCDGIARSLARANLAPCIVEYQLPGGHIHQDGNSEDIESLAGHCLRVEINIHSHMSRLMVLTG